MPSCRLPLFSSTSSAISPIIESLVMFPITESNVIKNNGTHKKKTNSVDPLSGVIPRLYEINAIGLEKATPNIQIITKLRLSKIFTSRGVNANAKKAEKKINKKEDGNLFTF